VRQAARARAVRWRSLPGWARLALAVYLAGFADGTLAHIRDLVRGGLTVYRHFGPVPVQVLLVSLVLIDPLVCLLIAAARRTGVVLAAVVMVADVLANAAGNRLLAHPGTLLRTPSLWPVPLFALVVLATAVPLLRALRTGTQAGQPAVPQTRSGAS
jgi:hypothetical protein